MELIHREKRRFSLTPAGEYFYRNSLRVLDEVERLKRETIQIGTYDDTRLRVGYLRCYGGKELHQVIAAFSEKYPEVSLEIVHGNHEDLYDLLRFGSVDMVLNDQRRAFSDAYVNFELVKSQCFIEISGKSALSRLEYVTLEELRNIPCILVASKEQQENESEYYHNTLGFGGSFLFAESLEEGRLMVAGNRGFMPVEGIRQDPNLGVTFQRLPLFQNGEPVVRNYCAFWKKERGGYYVEEFADMLRQEFAAKQKRLRRPGDSRF